MLHRTLLLSFLHPLMESEVNTSGQSSSESGKFPSSFMVGDKPSYMSVFVPPTSSSPRVEIHSIVTPWAMRRSWGEVFLQGVVQLNTFLMASVSYRESVITLLVFINSTIAVRSRSQKAENLNRKHSGYKVRS